ncbi:MAG TPA: TIGR03790 family protein [Desulfobacterales bacterium]|nr:TIGR03790 family protein [Desulfobacterales bacterium]
MPVPQGGIVELRTTTRMRSIGPVLLLGAAILLIIASRCWGLTPREILVVANRNVIPSISLAKHYMKSRGIPEKNLVTLAVPNTEHISGRDYEKDIAIPIRTYLKDKDPFRFIRCLVMMYGLPLKVDHPQPSGIEAELKTLKAKSHALKKQIKGAKEAGRKGELKEELRAIKNKILKFQHGNRNASLDSEIALVLERNYELAGWVPNPYFLGYQGKSIQALPRSALMVSRLDGPSAEIVRRMIDDTLLAEEKGLQGTAYFDARWLESEQRKTSGYSFYDQSIHRAARLVKESNLVPVVLNERPALFQPGDCPQAALYCGWYSLKKYIDAFYWQGGAVGYHIASGECTTLKEQNSGEWCKMMIEKGVAATLGPVSEPYVEAFPPPEVFFGLLLEGRLALAECFAASNPFWSWKMVLIGDPLYRPFKNHQTAGGARNRP